MIKYMFERNHITRLMCENMNQVKQVSENKIQFLNVFFFWITFRERPRRSVDYVLDWNTVEKQIRIPVALLRSPLR